MRLWILGLYAVVALSATACDPTKTEIPPETPGGVEARADSQDSMIACYSGGVEILLDYPKGGVTFLSAGEAHFVSAVSHEKVTVRADCIYRTRP